MVASSAPLAATKIAIFHLLTFFSMRHEHSHDHDVDQETSRVPSLFLNDRLTTDDRTGSSLSGNGSTTTTDALQCSYYNHLLTEQCTVYIHDCWRLAGGLRREGGGGARGWWDHT